MKKNYFLFTALLTGATLGSHAQNMVPNWLTPSNNAAITNSDDKPYLTHVDGNGMIGIIGVSNSKVILSTYDANGNDLWTNKYGTYSSDQPIGLGKGPSGNYYAAYFWGGTVRKINSTGGTVWTQGSSSYHGHAYTLDANGESFVVGTDYPQSTIYIDRISNSGNIVWTKTYTGYYGLGGKPVKALLDNAGNLLIAVNSTNSSGDRYISVVKFDTVSTNPNKIWDNAYTAIRGDAYDLRVDNTTNASYVTGSIAVGGFNQGDMIVYKSGPSGAINWNDVYNEANSDDKGCSLEQDAAGNVYVLMDSRFPMTKYSIRKYTSTGNLLATNGVTYQSNNVWPFMPKIKIHPGTNQVYFSATRTSFSNDNMMVLYKTDQSLANISQIYSYDHDVTDYDYSTSIDIDPTTQDLILTGNIFKTISGNDYYYAKTDTTGAFIFSNIYNGVINGSDYATSMAVDASNFPVVAGGTKSTTTGLDGFAVKYDAVGNEQWQGVYNGTSGLDDYFWDVDVNTSGHYYMGGFTTNSDKDMWLLKTDGNGIKQWDVQLAGTLTGGEDEVKDIFTDNFNNGYAVGYQTNNGTGRDAVVVKFNSSGSILWSKKLSGAGNAKDGYTCVIGKGGNPPVFAAGYTTKPNGESDMLLAKYDISGNLQWTATYNTTLSGNDTAIAISVDGNNNVYLAGKSDSCKAITVKFDANGTFQWARQEQALAYIGPDIITTAGGRVIVGCTRDSLFVDWNRIICYDNNGNTLWMKEYNYACCEYPMKMQKTNRNTIVFAMDFLGEAAVIELDTLGNEKNNLRVSLNVNGDAQAGGTRDMQIDNNGDIFVSGYFSQETGSDFFALKVCYTPAPVTISGAVNVCANTTGNIYSAPTNTTVTFYNWAATSGLTVNATIVPNKVSVDVMSTSGFVMLQQSNYCGTSPADSIAVNVLPLPAVNAGADQLICPGASVTLNGTGAASYSWDNGVTDGVSFKPTTSMAYQVMGTDTNNCSSSDTVIIALKQPPVIGLCQVTVDTFSTHNILTWEKAGLTNEISYFNIYREDITNNYTLIGAVSYDSLSEYHDYDTVMADPNITTKRYKIAAVDTCGNEGPKSNFHNTIFISHSGGTFTWNTYIIQNSPNPVNNYALLRDDFANGNWVQVGTTAGTQNVLNDPNYATFQATADWRVETQWNITCTPTMRQSNGVMATLVKSKSNITNNRVVGITNTVNGMFSVYPNPTNNNLNIVFANNDTKASVKIVSMLGQEVYSALVEGNTLHTIDMSNLENGSYMLQVITNNKTSVQRIIKQ